MKSIDRRALRRLALIPALWLTLASTAQAPTPQALVECRIGYDDAMAALKALPEERTEDLGNGQTNHVYAMPRDMVVFGFPANGFNALETHDSSRDSVTIMAPVAGAYDAVVAAAAKAHGKSDCLARGTGEPANCLILSRADGPWVVGLGIVQYRRETGVSCTYIRGRLTLH